MFDAFAQSGASAIAFWIACRTADAEVLARDPAAESVLPHPARDLAPPLVGALAGDHALAAATVYPRKLTAVLLSLLQLGHLLHQALASARLVYPGLCRVQKAMAKDLRAVPMAVGLCPHEFVRRFYRLQTAKATRVLRLRPALPLLRAVAARPACLFRAQMVTAKRLTRAPVLLAAPRDRLCHADQA